MPKRLTFTEIQLCRIADALEALVSLQEPEQPSAAASCQHPMETRISFGVTAGREDWQCGACGHRTVPPGS